MVKIQPMIHLCDCLYFVEKETTIQENLVPLRHHLEHLENHIYDVPSGLQKNIVRKNIATIYEV